MTEDQEKPTPRVIQLGLFTGTDKDVTDPIIEETNEPESAVEPEPEQEPEILTMDQIIQNRTDALVLEKGIYAPKYDGALQNMIKNHEAEKTKEAQQKNTNSGSQPNGL